MHYATISGGSSRGSFQAVCEDGSSFFIPKEVFIRKHLHLKQELSEEEFFLLKDGNGKVFLPSHGKNFLTLTVSSF